MVFLIAGYISQSKTNLVINLELFFLKELLNIKITSFFTYAKTAKKYMSYKNTLKYVLFPHCGQLREETKRMRRKNRWEQRMGNRDRELSRWKKRKKSMNDRGGA